MYSPPCSNVRWRQGQAKGAAWGGEAGEEVGGQEGVRRGVGYGGEERSVVRSLGTLAVCVGSTFHEKQNGTVKWGVFGRGARHVRSLGMGS